MNKRIVVVLVTLLLTISLLPIVEAKQSKIIEKRVYIHWAKGGNPNKPDKPDKGTGDGGKLWFKYSGLHWSGQDPIITYYLDTGSSNLPSTIVRQIIERSFDEWDQETQAEVFADTAIMADLTAGELDGINGISFGATGQGVIGVTSIWYYSFSGEVVEVDTLFSTNYQWSASGEPGKMDLGNIAVHEFGHWLVLEDMYNKPAREQTMYGYSTYGETSKQSIESGDVAGLETIYGE
jgi:hypothetical protein